MKLKATIFFFLFIFLFLEIRYNTFNGLSFSNINKKYFMPNHISNYWIAGTILNARENGFWSAKGFNARFMQDAILWKNQRKNNLVIYEGYKKKELPPGEFEIYKSALRLPTNVYVAIDMLLCNFFDKCSNLDLYISINTFLLALILILFCYWVALEYGYLSLIFVFIGIIMNHWLIRLGQLPNFALFIRFLPFIGGLFILMYYEQKKEFIKMKYVFIYVSLLIGLNQMIDYELTPLVMISVISPFFYYAIKNNWDKIFFFKTLAVASTACIFSFIVFFIIHIHLVSNLEGGYDKAIDYFQYSFFKRSNFLSGLEVIKDFELISNEIKCMNAPFSDVFFNLWQKKDLVACFNAKELLIGSIFCSIIIFVSVKFKVITTSKYLKDKYLALTTMLIISFAASVINIWLFKSHVACHQQLDYIFWCLPFTSISILLIGFSLQLVCHQIIITLK